MMNKFFNFFNVFKSYKSPGFNRPNSERNEANEINKTSKTNEANGGYAEKETSMGALHPYKNQLKEAIITINTKNIWVIPMIAGAFGLLFITNLFLVLHESRQYSNLQTTQNNKTSTILNQVNDIDSQLQQLASSPTNSQDFKSAITSISSDLANIQKSVAKSSDIDKVSNQLTVMKDDVDTQMLDIKKEVSGSADAKQYLDPDILPFQVISIDVISGQPFVSINYDNHLTPLAVGDSLAGWEITDADYSTSQVEFENSKNKYVKVNLQG